MAQRSFQGDVTNNTSTEAAIHLPYAKRMWIMCPVYYLTGRGKCKNGSTFIWDTCLSWIDLTIMDMRELPPLKTNAIPTRSIPKSKTIHSLCIFSPHLLSWWTGVSEVIWAFGETPIWVPGSPFVTSVGEQNVDSPSGERPDRFFLFMSSMMCGDNIIYTKLQT